MSGLPDVLKRQLKQLGVTPEEMGRMNANTAARIIGKRMPLEDWRDSQAAYGDYKKSVGRNSPKGLGAPADDPIARVLRDAGVPEETITKVSQEGTAANHPLVRSAQRGFVWVGDKMEPLSEQRVKAARADGLPQAEGWAQQLRRAKAAGTLAADDTPAETKPAMKAEAPKSKGLAVMDDAGQVAEAEPKKAPVVEVKKSRAVKKPVAEAPKEIKPVDTPKPAEPVRETARETPRPTATPKAKEKPAKKGLGAPEQAELPLPEPKAKPAPGETNLFSDKPATKAEYPPSRVIDTSFADLGEERPNSASDKPAGKAEYVRRSMLEGVPDAPHMDDTPDHFQRRALVEAGYSDRVVGMMTRSEAEAALGGTRVRGLGDPDVGSPTSSFQRDLLRRAGYPDEAMDLMTRKDAEFLAGRTPLKDAEGWKGEATEPPVTGKGSAQPADPSSGNPRSASDKPRAVSGPEVGPRRQGVESGGFASDKPRAVGPGYDRDYASKAIQSGLSPEDVRTQVDAKPNTGELPSGYSDAPKGPAKPVAADRGIGGTGAPSRGVSLADHLADLPEHQAPARPLGVGDRTRMALGRVGGALNGIGPVGQIVGAAGMDYLIQAIADEMASRQSEADAAVSREKLKTAPVNDQGFVIEPPVYGEDNTTPTGLTRDGQRWERDPNDRAAQANAQVDQILNAPPPPPSKPQLPAPAPQQAAPQPVQPQPQQQAPQAAPQAPLPQQKPAAPPIQQQAPQQAPIQQQAPAHKPPEENANNQASLKADLDKMFSLMRSKGIAGFNWGNEAFRADPNSPSGYVVLGQENQPAGPVQRAADGPPTKLTPV